MTPVDHPWEEDTLFPEAPGPGTYGFLSGRKPKTCSADELIRNCSVAQIPDISLVWTPDNARLVPKTEVKMLQPALEERLRSATKMGVLGAAFGVWMAFSASSGPSARRVWPIWLVFLVLPNVQSIADSVSALRALRRRRALGLEMPRDVEARFAFWIGSRRSRVTKVLAAGMVGIALVQLWCGLVPSVAAAGLVKDAVRQGEVWRLLTAGMLHANVWHLAGNMGALLAFGQMVEVLAHWSRLALVFLLSVLVGSLFSMVLLPHATSVGASGGLMGLLGFLVVLALRLPHALPPRFARSLVAGILWVAATGIIAYAFIDNAAHAGGLLAGAALALVLVPRSGGLPLDAGPRLVVLGTLCAVMLGLVLVACAAILLGGAQAFT